MRDAIESQLSIEPLSSKHDRSGFSCGALALDRYLARQAGQDHRKHVSAVFVLVEEASPSVLGYYTLAATSVQLQDLPENKARKLPRYPRVPAILLGRLAVDTRHRGKGYGELLLVDALKRCLGTREIGWAAVMVDAKDESAIAFYEHFHFIRLSEVSSRLFLPYATIAAELG
jgi:GNAT superfamily N-acetyltransferase